MFNSEVYVKALMMQMIRLQNVHRHKDTNKLYLRENSIPHTILYAREVMTERQWTVLPRPPYSSDLTLEVNLF